MENRYTLKVYIPGSSREFYRVLTICGNETMQRLCEHILIAINFDNDHLYEFYMTKRKHRGPTILGPGVDDYYGNNPYADEVELGGLGLVRGQKFYLHYDFGDDWMFSITVQKVERGVEYTKPAVVKSKGEIEQYPSWDDDDDGDNDDGDDDDGEA